MPTITYEAARNRENVDFDPRTRGETENSGTLTKAVRDVNEAIRLVKTNMKRFVSRAAEIQL